MLKNKDKSENGKNKRARRLIAAGTVSGFLNGLFGSGGGVLAVMFLRKLTGDEKKAHASATLMILIMSVVSFALYLINGSVDVATGWTFIPGGVAGAVVGAIFLKKVNSEALRKIFGAVIVISGIVMLIK